MGVPGGGVCSLLPEFLSSSMFRRTSSAGGASMTVGSGLGIGVVARASGLSGSGTSPPLSLASGAGAFSGTRLQGFYQKAQGQRRMHDRVGISRPHCRC